MRFFLGLACGALVALILVLLSIVWLIVSVRRDLHAELTAVVKVTETAQRDADDLGGAIEQICDAAHQADLAAREERTTWQKTATETYKTAASVRLLVVSTDKSLNDLQAGLLPQATKTLADADTNIATATTAAVRDANDTTASLAQVTAGMAQTEQDAERVLSDPSLLDTLHHLDATAVQTQQVAADARQASDLALKRIDEMMKPAKLSIRVLDFLGAHFIDGLETWFYLFSH